MRFFFFETCEIDRDGSGTLKPTLRPLPNQTFDDGTPVDVTMNVSAPKEPGTSANGTRFEYPLGTRFCSSHLEIDNTKRTAFLTVYDKSKGEGPTGNDPDFHPVSNDPNFQYKSPAHKDDRMNAAYSIFLATGDQTDDDGFQQAVAATTPSPGPTIRYEPADSDGKARKPIAGWQPAYSDQLDNEADLVVAWMRKTLTDNGITTMLQRPKTSPSVVEKISSLMKCGENADTICSRARLDRKMKEQSVDFRGLSIIKIGPLEWYLDQLVLEHDTVAECSYAPRSADSATDVQDAAFLLATSVNSQLGGTESATDTKLVEDVKKAIEIGWRVSDMLSPDILTSKGSAAGLASALATGAIPLPDTGAVGESFISALMVQKKNKCPSVNDGFFVDKIIWKVLVNNLYDKINTLLIGSTGSGKSELIKFLCDQTGTPCTFIQMGGITDPTEQLIGKMNLEAGPTGTTTEFDWAPFALAIQKPGVVVLDEINRIPRNGSNILFSVLDNFRTLSAPGAKGTDKREITVHPDCVFFATANIGADYTGTSVIDAALRNRFMPVRMRYLTVKEETDILKNRWKISEQDAKIIAQIATDIRKAKADMKIEHEVSTRETLLCARLVNRGFELQEAIELCFLPCFEPGRTENDTTGELGQVKSIIAGYLKSRKQA